MEKLSNKIANSVNELKETIKSAVNELKGTIKENLDTLANVKNNLSYAHSELFDIYGAIDELAIDMDVLAEDTGMAVNELENILEIIMPEDYGEEEDFDEDDDGAYIVVEDTETDEETEYPIN